MRATGSAIAARGSAIYGRTRSDGVARMSSSSPSGSSSDSDSSDSDGNVGAPAISSVPKLTQGKPASVMQRQAQGGKPATVMHRAAHGGKPASVMHRAARGGKPASVMAAHSGKPASVMHMMHKAVKSEPNLPAINPKQKEIDALKVEKGVLEDRLKELMGGTLTRMQDKAEDRDKKQKYHLDHLWAEMVRI